MTDRELQRILHHAGSPPVNCGPGPGFADSILRRLPSVRFVIPGSYPGFRALFLAGLLGLLTAAAVSLSGRGSPSVPSRPPSLPLFQPAAVESYPAPVSR